MPSEHDYCVFRLKRNPTNFHRDPATIGTTRDDAPAPKFRTTAAPPRAPQGLTVRAVNRATRAEDGTCTRQPAHAAAPSVSGSVTSHTSCTSRTSRTLADAAARAACAHEHATHSAAATSVPPASRALHWHDVHRQAVPPPACATDHLSGSGASVRQDLGLETRTRRPARSRASQQHVFLFAPPSSPAPLSASQVRAAESAAQPPWRASVVPASRASQTAQSVPLAAFVRGEACERGPIEPSTSTHGIDNRPSASSSATPAVSAMAGRAPCAGSVNQVYGTGARLDTSLYSATSLDGRGTTAALLRERHQTTSRPEAPRAPPAAAEPSSRTRYLETMEGHGRPW